MEICVEEMETNEDDPDFLECDDEPDNSDMITTTDTTTTTNITDPIVPELVTETAVDIYQSSFCWMCKFHGNPVCDKAATFVVDSIAHISFQNIVNQLFDHLNNSFPNDNINKVQLNTHMLHPRIKVARMIHRLSEMQSSISQDIVSHDVESEQTIINASAVKLYAVLTSQIASLYKLDEDKLMFKNISMDK
jgi:hypothetical protein